MNRPRPVDQAPRYQSPRFEDDTPTTPIRIVPNVAQKPRAYTETSLQSAQGTHFANKAEDIPDHIPQQVIDNPNHAAAREVVPGADKKASRIKRGIAVAVAASAIGAGIYGAGYLKSKGEIDAIKDAMGDDRSTSAEPFPNAQPSEAAGQESAPESPESMDADEFAGLPDDIRLTYVYEHFNIEHERTQALAEMLPWLTTEQRAIMEPGVPQGNKADYTPEEILRDTSIRAWAASAIDDDVTANMPYGEKEKLIQEHTKMYSTVVSPEHPEYDTLAGKIGYGKGALLGVSAVTAAYEKTAEGTLPFSDGSGRVHNFYGKLTQVMYVEDVEDGSTGIPVFQLVTTEGGDQEWLCIDLYDMDQVDMVNSLFQTLEAPR